MIELFMGTFLLAVVVGTIATGVSTLIKDEFFEN